MNTTSLKNKVEALKKKAKQLEKQQDQGKNFFGYRDAQNLREAAAQIDKAIYNIELCEL